MLCVPDLVNNEESFPFLEPDRSRSFYEIKLPGRVHFPTAMEEEEAELRNPFPSPPSHYKNYTNHNIQLLTLLRERVGDVDLSSVNQYEVLSDQQDVPDRPLAQLEKPRADWVKEEGHYSVYGDVWYVSELYWQWLNS